MIDWLQYLVTSGNIAILAIIFLALELAYFCARKNGAERIAIIFNAASGIAMLMALRAALTDAHFAWIPVFLTTSFAMHLIELRFRAKV